MTSFPSSDRFPITRALLAGRALGAIEDDGIVAATTIARRFEPDNAAVAQLAPLSGEFPTLMKSQGAMFPRLQRRRRGRLPRSAMPPAAPIERIEPTAPIEPTLKMLPIEPIEQNEPMEPMEKALPIEPIEQNDPMEPIARTLRIEVERLALTPSDAIPSWGDRLAALLPRGAPLIVLPPRSCQRAPLPSSPAG
jgi:hypothetical protein